MNDITKVGETLNANETMNSSDNFELIKITETTEKVIKKTIKIHI